MDELIPVALATLAGGCLAAASGFGFALVLAPVAFAVLPAEEAIWLITGLSVLVNLLTLATEGRRPRVLRDVPLLLAWSVPGSLAGVAVLRAVPDVALQGLVTVAVLGSLAVRRAAPGRLRLPAWLAGLSTGALNTSVGTGGPPLVLYLLHRDASPGEVRDTLGALFLAGALIAAGMLALTGVEPLPDTTVVAVCAPLAVLGHLAGRRVFRHLEGGGYEAVLVTTLVAAALGGLLRALG